MRLSGIRLEKMALKLVIIRMKNETWGSTHLAIRLPFSLRESPSMICPLYNHSRLAQACQEKKKKGMIFFSWCFFAATPHIKSQMDSIEPNSSAFSVTHVSHMRSDDGPIISKHNKDRRWSTSFRMPSPCQQEQDDWSGSYFRTHTAPFSYSNCN